MPTPHLEVSRGGIKPATLFHSSSLRLTKDQFKERLKALNSDMRAQDFEIDRCIHHRTSGPQLICKSKRRSPVAGGEGGVRGDVYRTAEGSSFPLTSGSRGLQVPSPSGGMDSGFAATRSLVSAQLLMLSSHSPGEPVSRGQLGGTVSCLKSSQFTGSFKVSTPTRGP